MLSSVQVARLLGLFVVFTALSVTFGCSGATTSSSGLNAGSGPFAGLPAIPLDVPGHHVSDVHNAQINGVDTFLRSSGAINSGQNLLLFTGETNPPSLEWGIYRYIPDSAQSEVVNTVDFTFTVNAGPNGWIGIANYGTGMWEFKGPYNSSGGGGSKTFDNLNLGDYTSPGGNLYFLAMAYNGSTMTFNGLNITSNITPAVTYTISGKAIDSSTSQGIPSVTIHCNALSTTTNASGDYSFSGLTTGNYTLHADDKIGYDPFSPLNIPVSITNADSTGNDFTAPPSGPQPVTYSTGAHIMKDMIDTYCIRCHQPGGPPGAPPLTTYNECAQVGFDNIEFKVTFGAPNASMPQAGSPEKTQINANNDRHWFTDWKNNGYAQ